MAFTIEKIDSTHIFEGMFWSMDYHLLLYFSISQIQNSKLDKADECSWGGTSKEQPTSTLCFEYEKLDHLFEP